MTVKPVLADIQLTAFMASRICHDLVGPIGAISNGLELLEEETDEDTRAYAQEVILSSAQAAWTRLEFARLAFGASSGMGQGIDTGQAERIARGYVEEGKHRLNWNAADGVQLDKTHARLLMIMIAIAIPALPVGGELEVDVTEGGGCPNAHCMLCGPECPYSRQDRGYPVGRGSRRAGSTLDPAVLRGAPGRRGGHGHRRGAGRGRCRLHRGSHLTL